MSDDIVDRLRAAAWGSTPHWSDLRVLAADEIVRLRERVTELEATQALISDGFREVSHNIKAERSLTTQLFAEIVRLNEVGVSERALADQLAEALRRTYAMDMSHYDRVVAHNLTVRALYAYDRARNPETPTPPTHQPTNQEDTTP